MNILLLICTFLSTTTTAWVTPPNVKRAFSIAAMTAVLSSSPIMIANAVADFDGSYSDPKHLNCQRVITTVSPGKVDVSGTDGNPTCPPDGSGKVWKLNGAVSGSSIFVDFSPKGGPANLKGTFLKDSTSDSWGIQWPDGNFWTKKPVYQSIS